MHELLKRALEQRANVFNTAREALERAEAEGRALTGEAETAYTNAMDDVKSLDGKIAEYRGMIASERAADEAAALLGGRGAERRDAETAPVGGMPSNDEFRTFLSGAAGREMRFAYDQGVIERRDMYTGNNGSTSSNGEADLIAETFVRSLYEMLRETSIIRELSQTLVTASGEKMTFPRITGRPAAQKVDEGGQIQKSDPTFAKQSLEAYKYAFIAQMSQEMTTDPAVNLVPFLVAAGREALGEAQAADFMVGDGTAGPLGIFPGATITKNAASASAIAFDELLDLKYAIKRGYRRNALYVVSDDSVAALAKVKDDAGNYAWKTSGRDGEPDTIHGKRVEVDPNAPSIGADARSVAFLDPARAYLIRDVGEVRVDRSTEYAFDTDEIAWRFIARADGGVWDDNGLAVLVHPAA